MTASEQHLGLHPAGTPEARNHHAGSTGSSLRFLSEELGIIPGNHDGHLPLQLTAREILNQDRQKIPVYRLEFFR